MLTILFYPCYFRRTMISASYLTLLEALRVSCNLPEFPDPLPSTELDLELENGPTVTIDFEDETDSLQIFSQIGTYSDDRELEILKKIAEANYLWKSTAGATLSVRPEIQTVYLAYQTPVLSLNGLEFVDFVEKFIAMVIDWQKFLSGNSNELTITADSSDSLSPLGEAESENSAPPIPGSSNFIVG